MASNRHIRPETQLLRRAEEDPRRVELYKLEKKQRTGDPDSKAYRDRQRIIDQWRAERLKEKAKARAQERREKDRQAAELKRQREAEERRQKELREQEERRKALELEQGDK